MTAAVRLGVCAAADQASLVAAAGADYIELPAAGELVPMADDGEWARHRAAITAMPLVPEAFVGFIRQGAIIGPERDPEYLRGYVDRGLRRAAEVGGKVIVFGSGGARRIPEGFPRDEADRQLMEFLGFCADASDATGVLIALEPLRRAENNYIHLVGEAAGYARSLGRPGVRVLADAYHMEEEGEPLSAIPAAADVLAHAHVADTGRRPPGLAGYDHTALFRALADAGYQGRLSIECRWDDFDAQVGPALDHLRAARAGA